MRVLDLKIFFTRPKIVNITKETTNFLANVFINALLYIEKRARTPTLKSDDVKLFNKCFSPAIFKELEKVNCKDCW